MPFKQPLKSFDSEHTKEDAGQETRHPIFLEQVLPTWLISSRMSIQISYMHNLEMPNGTRNWCQVDKKRENNDMVLQGQVDLKHCLYEASQQSHPMHWNAIVRGARDCRNDMDEFHTSSSKSYISSLEGPFLQLNMGIVWQLGGMAGHASHNP